VANKINDNPTPAPNPAKIQDNGKRDRAMELADFTI
jgi:hypothetical protein